MDKGHSNTSSMKSTSKAQLADYEIPSNTEKKEDNSNAITSNKKVSLDDFIAENFVLLNIAGKGAFGEIYFGTNIQKNENVAIKLESTKTRHPQLLAESKLYIALQGGSKHIKFNLEKYSSWNT